MIYTDGTHIVADTLSELHEFAKEVGISRGRFHGYRKGHPHYDLKDEFVEIVIARAKPVRPRDALKIAKLSKLFERSTFL